MWSEEKYLLVGHVSKKLAVLHEVCKWRRNEKGDGVFKIDVGQKKAKDILTIEIGVVVENE